MKVIERISASMGNHQEFTILECDNPECKMKMVLIATFIFENGSHEYMEQSNFSYCPYCGKEQVNYKPPKK